MQNLKFEMKNRKTVNSGKWIEIKRVISSQWKVIKAVDSGQWSVISEKQKRNKLSTVHCPLFTVHCSLGSLSWNY